MKTNLVRAALVCAALAFTSMAADAGSVTAPAGGTHSATLPLTIVWNGISTSGGTVDIEMNAIGWLTIDDPIAQNVPNTGQYTIAASRLEPLVCTMIPTAMGATGYIPWSQPVGQITFSFTVHPTGHSNPSARSVDFKMTCPATPGTLSVVKHVVNATGGTIFLPSSFSITPQCAVPNQNQNQSLRSATSLSVSPNQSVSVSGIAAGSVCSVTEDALGEVVNAKGCPRGRAFWTTTYSPAVTIQSNTTATITVTNTLSCKPRPARADEFDDGDEGRDMRRDRPDIEQQAPVQHEPSDRHKGR